MKTIGLDNNFDLLVTNDINGDTFAVVTKGENQDERVLTAIQEEFDDEVKSIHVTYSDFIPNINFEVTFENDGKQIIKLVRAFIY